MNISGGRNTSLYINDWSLGKLLDQVTECNAFHDIINLVKFNNYVFTINQIYSDFGFVYAIQILVRDSELSLFALEERVYAFLRPRDWCDVKAFRELDAYSVNYFSPKIHIKQVDMNLR